jgi:hypothetical protein
MAEIPRHPDVTTWYVRYQLRGSEGLLVVRTLPLAIAKACKLPDQSAEVSQIEGSGGLKGMSSDEIRRVYGERRAKNALH